MMANLTTSKDLDFQLFEKTFKMVDIDRSGSIDKEEMEIFLREILSKNIMSVIDKVWQGYQKDADDSLNKK